MNVSAAFIWFYCLDYGDVLLLIFLFTLFYEWIIPCFVSPRCYNILNRLMIILWVILILAATLYSRNETLHAPALIPFHSYREAIQTGSEELYRSNFMNAVLFFPLGIFLGSSLQKTKSSVLLTLVLSFAFSFSIEYLQYYFLLGQPEIDDVIHNVLGAVIGAGFHRLAHLVLVSLGKDHHEPKD